MFKHLIIAIAFISTSLEAGEIKYLHYKFSDSVLITISNVDCPYPEIKDEYPKAVLASRIDGQHLTGCFKKLDEDNIQIQWFKGDKTVFPANVFLQAPSIDKKEEPKITM